MWFAMMSIIKLVSGEEMIAWIGGEPSSASEILNQSALIRVNGRNEVVVKNINSILWQSKGESFQISSTIIIHITNFKILISDVTTQSVILLSRSPFPYLILFICAFIILWPAGMIGLVSEGFRLNSECLIVAYDGQVWIELKFWVNTLEIGVRLFQ